MTAVVSVGLLGCGVVGSAVMRALARGGEHCGIELRALAVREIDKARPCHLPPGVLTDDVTAVVEDPGVDVVVEVMGGVSAAGYAVRRALELGKPVVTANKALLGADPRLRWDAGRRGVPLLLEAAVGGAIPVIQTISSLRAGARISRVEAVLNGTVNYVLWRMETEAVSMHDAVAAAQELGYAEADPTRDLDGSDAADKVAVLAQCAFDEPVETRDVRRRGIDGLSAADIAGAIATGRRWRLVATAAPGGRVKVEPVALPAHHPFARLSGAENCIAVTTQHTGTLWLAGQGAGGDPTASAVMADLVPAAAWVRSQRARREPHALDAATAPAVATAVDSLSLREAAWAH